MPRLGFRGPSVRVVIAGGGVAALETALALRQLARKRVAMTLVAPNDEFVYQPMAVAAPFFRGSHARHLSLATFAADVHAVFEHDSVVSVDSERRVLLTGSGRELTYDALVIAAGARSTGQLPAALTLDPRAIDEGLHELIPDIENRSVKSVAFVIPSRTTWPLPAYEVALLTQERARDLGIELQVTIVTVEDQPLAVFGSAASAGLTEVLSDVGIEAVVGASVEVPRTGEVVVHPDERHLHFDRVVAVPQLSGPAIEGLPSNADGFFPIGTDSRVQGMEHVYAVGDASDFPLKYGGISAKQADAAAESIAALAGYPGKPQPFETDVHGMLLTSRRGTYLYVSARIEEGVAHDSRVSTVPTSSPPAKIASRYLGPYLDKLWGVAPPSTDNWHAWSFLGLDPYEPGGLDN